MKPRPGAGGSGAMCEWALGLLCGVGAIAMFGVLPLEAALLWTAAILIWPFAPLGQTFARLSGARARAIVLPLLAIAWLLHGGEIAFAMAAALPLLLLLPPADAPPGLRECEESRARNRELAAAVADRQRQLRAVNRSSAAVLAAASHDLRQPVHALGVLAELMDAADPSSVAHRLPSVRSCVRSASQMLDQLLDFERLDRQTYTPAAQPVALHSLVGEVQASLQACAHRKGLLLRIDAEPAWVMSDARLLRRMLFNLVTNAIKFTARGGVRICCRITDGRVRLAVTDTGVGIAPERLHEVFQEHVSLRPGTAGECDGLGLGLSIVAKAARILGHRIGLESTVGCGTRFTVELGHALHGCAEPFHPQELAELPRAVVAVVENDPIVLGNLLDSLSAWGCLPLGGRDLAQLEDQLHRTRATPALLLCDLHLGEGPDGFEVIGRLRARVGRPHLSAILLTGDVDAGLQQGASAHGVWVARKPMPPAQLRRMIGAALLQASPWTP